MLDIPHFRASAGIPQPQEEDEGTEVNRMSQQKTTDSTTRRIRIKWNYFVDLLSEWIVIPGTIVLIEQVQMNRLALTFTDHTLCVSELYRHSRGRQINGQGVDQHQ